MTAVGRRSAGVAAIAAAGLIWLALFAVLYTLGDLVGAWPEPRPGAFANVDLCAGLAAGVALFVGLVLRPEKG